MKRVIFVNRYFFPDHSATSQILSDLAFHLAQTGHEVHVIAGRHRYDDQTAVLPAKEVVRGVTVHRVLSARFGRASLLHRAIDYAGFYRDIYQALKTIVTRGDLIIAKTDPPLASIPAMFAAQARGALLINWLQDVYPEIATQLGVSFLNGPLGYLLRGLRNRSVRAAAGNVVVGDRMRAKVSAFGPKQENLHVIPNWVNDQQILPISTNENPLRDQWKLRGNFVVGYSGNLGRAHEYETILSAARLLHKHATVRFLFIGGGHLTNQLQKCVEDEGLDHLFEFMPYQEQTELSTSLSLPDVHWLSLRPELEGLIVPSKFYGIAAAGRPIIAIASRQGEFASLIEKHGCGLVIEPKQGDALAAALITLSNDPNRCAAMGEQARKMSDAHFSRRAALHRWTSLIDSFL